VNRFHCRAFRIRFNSTSDARRIGKKIAGIFSQFGPDPVLTSRAMTRGSAWALVIWAAFGCQSSRAPAGSGGSGGDGTGGAESGGASGKAGSGGSGGQPRLDAAPDLAAGGPDLALPLDGPAADLPPSVAPDAPPASGPAKIVLVAGGGNGGDGSPAAMAKLSVPFGTAVDPMNGDIYIAEFTGRVRRIDDKGIISTVVGTGAPGPGGKVTLDQPHDLLFRPGTRTLFIGDTYAKRVVKMDAATGEAVAFAGAGTQVAAGIGRTFHLAFDKSGDHLYVTDYEGGKVAVIDLATSAVNSIAVGANPRVHAVDSKGNLYVVNNNAVMKKFDPMGGSSTAVGGLAAPKHLAIDHDDSVIICDTEVNLIRRWTPGSTTTVKIAGTGAEGTGMLGGPPEQAAFKRPHGVFVDAQGRLYIADSDNNRVLRIER
jgi:YVTN family beta-propeller protein